MSNIPADLKYTKSHEWVRTLADGNVEIGITDHAQGALGDLVFVEVPEGGKSLKAEPYGAGWIARMKPNGAPQGLLSAAEYQAHLAAEG